MVTSSTSHVPTVSDYKAVRYPSTQVSVGWHAVYSLACFKPYNLSYCRLDVLLLSGSSRQVSVGNSGIWNLNSISDPSYFNPFQTPLSKRNILVPVWGNEIDFLHLYTRGSLGNNATSRNTNKNVLAVEKFHKFLCWVNHEFTEETPGQETKPGTFSHASCQSRLQVRVDGIWGGEVMVRGQLHFVPVFPNHFSSLLFSHTIWAYYFLPLTSCLKDYHRRAQSSEKKNKSM